MFELKQVGTNRSYGSPGFAGSEASRRQDEKSVGQRAGAILRNQRVGTAEGGASYGNPGPSSRLGFPSCQNGEGQGMGGGEGDGLGTETAQALEMGETQGQKSTTACRREQVT